MKYLVFLFFVVASCTFRVPDQMSYAQHLLAQNKADSAYIVLSSIVGEDDFPTDLKIEYIFLLLNAQEESDVIISDSVVNILFPLFQNENSMQGALTHFYKGISFQQINDYENATKHFAFAEKIAAKLKDISLSAKIHKRQAMLFYSQYLIPEMVKYAKYSLDEYKQCSDTVSWYKMLNTIGSYYVISQEYDSSYLYLSKALYISRKYRDTSMMASAYHNLGIIALNKNDIDKAKYFFLRKQKLVSVPKSVPVRIALSKIYMHENKLDSARMECDTILSAAKAIKDSLYAYSSYLALEKEQGNYIRALYIAEEMLRMQDDIYKEFSQNSILEYEQKYRAQEIEEEYEHIKEKQRHSLVIFIFFVFLCILASLYVIQRKSRYILRLERDMLQSQISQEKLREILFIRVQATKNKLLYINGKNVTESSLPPFERIEDIMDMTNTAYNGYIDRLHFNFPSLTDMEIKHCCLACAGFSTKEIACYLGISEGRATSRRSEIMKKVSQNSSYIKFHQFIREFSVKKD